MLPAVLLLAPALAQGADAALPAERDLFENFVRPVLTARCLRCHGEAKQENGLRLTSRDALLAGGDSGPAIVPGKPAESLLRDALRYESFEMPPDGQLEIAQIEGIERWIAAGAPWPAGVELTPAPKITVQDRQWWCFQPIADPRVPDADDDGDGWCRNEIDRFIFARLAAEGVAPSHEADPATLARRVYFAVVGLSPDESTVNALVAGKLSFDALVDQLLNDPAYGENQARYWLDLARYAETDGYRADGARPEAHRYRDYVIRSFNSDKPYDQFVTEQLAGDEVDPGNRDALIATMYLRHWIYEWNQRDVETQWQEILGDLTETTADVFLALGMKCARCHDHKFDPLLQQDYYRLQAFFAAFQPREDLPVADLATRTAWFERQRNWEDATDEIRRRLHEIEQPVLLAHTTKEGFEKFVPEIRGMIVAWPADRAPYDAQIAALASRQFDIHPDKLPEWLTDSAAEERQALLERLREYESLKPEPLPTIAFVAGDVGPIAPPTYIPGDRSAPIEPGYPTILDASTAAITPTPPALVSTGRRTALARWIVDPANPLTARVMVNRIWQQHFGRGLVETPSDFGRLGAPPSHPELLDWLARRFVEDGWSIKALHRRILTSATWRQSSRRRANDKLRKLDPGNTLLWRMNARRLAGEEINDAILSATGELPKQRRAIFKPVKRNSPDPLLALFDFPDRIRSQDRRHRTTTATQALLLLNNSWSHERAAALVARLADKSDADFVREAYTLLFSRQPDEAEQGMADLFLAAYAAVDSETDSGAAPRPAHHQARAALVHALLNSNELIYVD
ncbi:MAG: PSD1 and planctomycete cytochrome C domain-containing protein [Pirellulales bacterium]